MADDRLAPRTHPVLGKTIGFRTAPGEMDGDGYRGFEDLFRGSEQMIRDRQRVYVDLIAGREPVLDAGCGRGEFLDLLEEHGIACRGVDLDPDMVKRCREKGHENVEQGSLIECLERTPAGSLGAIFSAQVIEHLELAQLQRFLELGLSRLRPGGLLIAETVNPHSAAALKAFWVDPTHMHPLFPETMLSLCALAGYAAGDVFAPVGYGRLGGGPDQGGRVRGGRSCARARFLIGLRETFYAVETGLPSPSKARSASTITFTSCSKSTVGCQPNSSRAFVGSAMSRSTSAGRMNAGSSRTYSEGSRPTYAKAIFTRSRTEWSTPVPTT